MKTNFITIATLFQDSAADMSFRIGDDSWNGTPFFTSLMNLMQPEINNNNQKKFV